MPAEDDAVHAGDVMQLVGLAGLEGMRVTVVKNLSKDKWAVTLDGEDKKSKVVSAKNLTKPISPAGPPKSYSIVGTWDDWETHEMAWDSAEGRFEYTVVMRGPGVASFKLLQDGDWDLCVCPDRNDANPYEDHAINGPGEDNSDAEWAIGARPEDNAQEGARYKVFLYVTLDGRPKRVTWEAPGAGGGSAQESSAPAGAPAAQRAAAGQRKAPSGNLRASVKDLLKKLPPGGSSKQREEPPAAPTPGAPEREAPRSSMLPRSTGRKAEEPAETAPAVAASGQAAANPPGRTTAAGAASKPLSEALREASKPLGTVLREAWPQATAQELAMTKSKLMRVGVKTSEDLLQTLQEGQLQERLSGAGRTPSAPDLVEALASIFGVPARAAATARAAQATPRARSVPKAKRQAAPRVPAPKLWEITGGAETGGLRVRSGPSTSSETLPDKLSCGALVEEIEIEDGRLHYEKRSGVGPQRGWILLELKGKELAQRLPEEEKEAEPKPVAAAPPAEDKPEARAAARAPPRAENAEAARPQEAELPIELRRKAQGLQVPLEKLHDQSPSHVAEFLDRMERVHKSTASKLQAQYLELGFPVDEDDMVERAEMTRLVAAVLLRQELQLIPLQEVCAGKGLSVTMEQSREDLLALLMNLEWENAGIPITRISREDALRVLSKIRAAESSGTSKLMASCKLLGLPTSASTETMTSQLKKALVWKVLPTEELLCECRAHGLSPSAEDLGQDSAHEELYQQLVSVMRGNRAEARGIPAGRLGSVQLADELLQSVDRLQVMGPLSLQVEYQKMGVSFAPKMDTQALIDRLRDMLVWEALPMEELQKDCRERGLPADSNRKAMLQRLRRRLDDELELEAQGLPVRRLGGYEAAMELMDTFEGLDQLPMEDLLKLHAGMGCPEDDCTTKEDLVKLMKAMAVWEALPMTELSQECVQNKVALKDLHSVGGEDEQREFLVKKLMQERQMRIWEERGFKAERIGDFEAVCQLLRRYHQLRDMNDQDLALVFAEWGLPSEPGMDREAKLKTLKTVMIWEAMPLFDLQMECLKCSDEIQCDFESKGNEGDQKTNLVRQLTVELLRTAYEHIGVPVSHIGLLDSFSVGKELVGFTIMDEQELQAKCQEYSLAVHPGTTAAELGKSLRNFILWDVLPVDDLLAECQRRGVHEQLRNPIISLLMAKLA